MKFKIYDKKTNKLVGVIIAPNKEVFLNHCWNVYKKHCRYEVTSNDL